MPVTIQVFDPAMCCAGPTLHEHGVGHGERHLGEIKALSTRMVLIPWSANR